MTQEGKAKAAAEEGKGEASDEQTPGEKAEAEANATKLAEEKASESEITPENAVQQAKTFQGMLKKSQSEVAKLTEERQGFTSLTNLVNDLTTKLTEQGNAVDLLTDIVANSETMSEESQEKVKKAREATQARQTAFTGAKKMYDRIAKIAEAAGLSPESEELKGAREAWNKGDPDEALDLTIVASMGAVRKTATTTEPEETATEKAAKAAKEEKAKGRRAMTSRAAPKPAGDLTSTEKVTQGLAERRAKQD